MGFTTNRWPICGVWGKTAEEKGCDVKLQACGHRGLGRRDRILSGEETSRHHERWGPQQVGATASVGLSPRHGRQSG